MSAVRRLYAQRQSMAAADRAFILYVAALLVLIYVVPTVIVMDLQALVLSATQALGSVELLIATIFLIGLLGAGLQGMVFGPARLPHLPLAVLTRTEIPPGVYLVSPLRKTLAGVALLLSLGWLWLLIESTQTSATVAVTLAVAMALQTVLVWFLGQRLGTWGRAAMCGLLVVLLPISWTVRWAEWLTTVWLFPALFLPLVLLVFLPHLIDSFPAPRLLGQAARFSEAGLYFSTGDLRGAAGAYRAAPRPWRGRRPVGLPGTPSGRALAVWVRGMSRFPLQSLLVAVGVVAVGFCGISLGMAVEESLQFLGLGILGGVLHLSTRRVGVPWQYVRELATGEQVAGNSARRTIFCFLWVPIFYVWLLLLIGATGAWYTGLAPFSGHALVLLPLLTLVAMAVRLMTAMKDRMPSSVSAPAPTPFGDLSGLVILFWYSDGLLLAVVAGLLIATGGASVALTVSGIGLLALWVACRRLGLSIWGLFSFRTQSPARRRAPM